MQKEKRAVFSLGDLNCRTLAPVIKPSGNDGPAKPSVTVTTLLLPRVPVTCSGEPLSPTAKCKI
jgi:hypothetical protein